MESRPHGAQTALNTVIAPRDAFVTLRSFPTWAWAYLIVVVLALIGQFLAIPAAQHIFEVTMPVSLEHNKQILAMPEAQRSKVIAQQLAFGKIIAYLALVVVPIIALLIALIQAAVLTAVNAMVRGTGRFKNFWALCINVEIVGYGISYIVLGGIAAARGAGSFNNQQDFYAVIPSLGWIIPSTAKQASVFLQTINVFMMWAGVLLALGAGIIGGFSRGVQIALGVVFVLASAGISAAFAGLSP